MLFEVQGFLLVGYVSLSPRCEVFFFKKNPNYEVKTLMFCKTRFQIIHLDPFGRTIDN